MKDEEQKDNNLSKKDEKETLTEQEHRLLVEGYSDKGIEELYSSLRDLDIADLSDYFLLERRYGRN